MCDMCELASDQLPLADTSEEGRTLTYAADPEWTCVPEQMRIQAASIRARVPSYLEELDIAVVEDFDLVLNEALARPTSSADYIGILREIQEVCGDKTYLLCELLELQMGWSELMRDVVQKAVGREGEFSVYELFDEIRGAQ